MTVVLDWHTMLSGMVKKVSDALKDMIKPEEPRCMQLKLPHGVVKAQIIEQEEDSYLVEYPYTESWFGSYTATCRRINADDPRVLSIDPPRRERNVPAG